jgi:hypothetical protein
MTLDDPVLRLLTVKVRDAEKAMLRAKDQYEVAAAKQAHQEALQQLERMRSAERG